MRRVVDIDGLSGGPPAARRIVVVFVDDQIRRSLRDGRFGVGSSLPIAVFGRIQHDPELHRFTVESAAHLESRRILGVYDRELGAPLPLLPLQILYLNLLNDVFPALALGVEPGSGHEMEAPPRSGDSQILERPDWQDVGVYGAFIALAVGAGFAETLGPAGFSVERAVTVSFLFLSVARLLHVFNVRRSDSGVLVNEISRNPYVWGALGLDIGLLMLAVYVPPLAGVLSLTPPGPFGWLLVVATSILPLLVGQLDLFARRSRRPTSRSAR